MFRRKVLTVHVLYRKLKEPSVFIGFAAALLCITPLQRVTAESSLNPSVIPIDHMDVDELPFIGQSSQQRNKQISGKIVDINGEPIIGANIIEKGTTNGIITDVDGNFSLEVPSSAILQISYIGYVTQEIEVGNQTTFAIQLMEDTQKLDEVVVVGYGTMKKKDLTGAVKRVNLENSPAIANTSLSQALIGSTAGVNTTQSGYAGEDVTLSIRGATSFSASQSPLIVLDGIIYNGSMSDINVNDISSIDILKDASAAAVYGARSANGVILVTTKKGKTQSSAALPYHSICQ